MAVTLEVKDGLTDELKLLSKKARNMSGAMSKIESRVMKPLKRKAWKESGLQSRSGELESSVKTFSGKKSAGISVHKPSGRSLVSAKAVSHTEGRRARSQRKKSSYRVRSHSRGNVRVRQHQRKNVGAPWGNVPAREFVPVKIGKSGTQVAVKIIEEYFDV